MCRVELTDRQLQTMADIYKYRGLPNRWKILERVFDIKVGDIILDCGAFHGDMAFYFAKKVGNKGKVYSIEAHPDNIDKLKVNIKVLRLRSVEIIDKALSDEISTIRFYRSDYNNAWSILEEFRKVNKESFIDVESTTIDKLGIDKIDFIWMNIEGAEVKALRGAKQTLKKCNCKLLISTHKITDNYYTTQDVIDILESYGYKVNVLDDRPTWVYAEK